MFAGNKGTEFITGRPAPENKRTRDQKKNSKQRNGKEEATRAPGARGWTGHEGTAPWQGHPCPRGSGEWLKQGRGSDDKSQEGIQLGALAFCAGEATEGPLTSSMKGPGQCSVTSVAWKV